jgi:hypothetical protein
MPLANCQSISTGRKNMATYYLTNGTMQSLETVLQLALDYLYLKTILETILQNQWYSTFTKSIYYHHCYQLMPLPGSLPSGADQYSSGENHRPSFSTSLSPSSPCYIHLEDIATRIWLHFIVVSLPQLLRKKHAQPRQIGPKGPEFFRKNVTV